MAEEFSIRDSPINLPGLIAAWPSCCPGIFTPKMLGVLSADEQALSPLVAPLPENNWEKPFWFWLQQQELL